MGDYRRNKRIVYNDLPLIAIKTGGDDFPLKAERNPRLPEKKETEAEKRPRAGTNAPYFADLAERLYMRNRRVCYTAERDEKTAESEAVLDSMLLPTPSSLFRFTHLPRPE